MTSLKGGYTFLESNSGNNQDWIGAGGDPDTVDTDNFNQSSRNDLRHIWTQTSDPGWKTNINRSAFPGDFQIATPLGENDDMVAISGFVETVAERNLLKAFAANHNNIADERIYMVGRFAASSYEQFADGSRVMQDYAPGFISDVKTPYDAKRHRYDVTVIFQIVWS
ncbi:MAG: hypothetical protein ACYTBJ_11385 [Planctomycetota bacterium]|jgi:hypothetical protein